MYKLLNIFFYFILKIYYQEYEEKKLIEQNSDAERRKLQKQHEKDIDEVRREFTRKKDTLTEQLEAEVSYSYLIHFETWVNLSTQLLP